MNWREIVLKRNSVGKIEKWKKTYRAPIGWSVLSIFGLLLNHLFFFEVLEGDIGYNIRFNAGPLMQYSRYGLLFYVTQKKKKNPAKLPLSKPIGCSTFQSPPTWRYLTEVL